MIFPEDTPGLKEALASRIEALQRGEWPEGVVVLPVQPLPSFKVDDANLVKPSAE